MRIIVKKSMLLKNCNQSINVFCICQKIAALEALDRAKES